MVPRGERNEVSSVRRRAGNLPPPDSVPRNYTTNRPWLRAVGYAFLIAALIIGLAFVSSALLGTLNTEKETASEVKVIAAGIDGVACMLRLPPAGTPGGRTDADVTRCLAEFDRLRGG